VTHVLPAALQPAPVEPVPVDVPAERVARRRRARAAARAYLALTKPRIIELLLVTTVPAMLLAGRGLPPLATGLVTVLAGTLAAASANALNCYFDRDIDAVMRRTGQRPLAQQAVTPRSALVFGLVLGVLAVGWMAAATNLLAAGLTLAAILFYVLVYTLGLKRRTAQNIVWGGAAGCMPVLIGWAAVRDSLAWPPVVLFAVVFLWTPPHFWALAMRFRDDYARAGVPMLPVVATPQVVASRIVGYTWATVAASLLLWPLATGWPYGVAALTLGGWFLAQAYALRGRVRRAPTAADPRVAASLRLFRASNSYLALLFLAVAVDALLAR
jgi:protoheme IX farnesyltransferase